MADSALTCNGSDGWSRSMDSGVTSAMRSSGAPRSSSTSSGCRATSPVCDGFSRRMRERSMSVNRWTIPTSFRAGVDHVAASADRLVVDVASLLQNEPRRRSIADKSQRLLLGDLAMHRSLERVLVEGVQRPSAPVDGPITPRRCQKRRWGSHLGQRPAAHRDDDVAERRRRRRVEVGFDAGFRLVPRRVSEATLCRGVDEDTG